MQLFRTANWGALATIQLLDTRQFRSPQVCASRLPPNSAALCVAVPDPDRTMLGAAQETWLGAALQRSTARWDVLAQQIMFVPVARTRDDLGFIQPPGTVNVDSWDGYPAARQLLLDSVHAADVRNLIVLTGDVHWHWAADIPGPIDGLPMGVELVATSVTSRGDGDPEPSWVPEALARQRHLHYWDGRRGWIAGHLNAERLRADYHVVQRVSTPYWPDAIAASFEVTDGVSGLRRI
jgi:alkaline phosphatase D